MPTTVPTGEGYEVAVHATGPAAGAVVAVLGAAAQPPAGYDPVCRRLHTAALRTVVVGADPRLTPKAVLGVLDSLGIGWALLVGDRAGAELAWELAAVRLDRFIGLVAIDRGHPRVPDPAGVVRDDQCPPVELDTTVLVSSPVTRAAARDSARYVYGDYRVVETPGRRNPVEGTLQLAAEIVLRSSPW